MEINGYSKTRNSKLYKTALSRYEEAIDRARETMPSDQNEKTTRLPQEGKVIKGEVIDLRFQEAKIRLEPGGQVITAKIDGKVHLFIGQSAEFVITDKTDEQITLRLVSSDNIPMHDIVYKALSAAGLTATEKNKAIVRELLNFQMPVDKETILKLIKLTSAYPNTDIKTLILLLKNQLPVNPVNIAQLEAYQKGMHQILGELNILIENIGIYLENMASQTGSDTAVSNQSLAGTVINHSNRNNGINDRINGLPDLLNTGEKTAYFQENGISRNYTYPSSNINNNNLNNILNLYKELFSIINDRNKETFTYSFDTPLQSVLSDSELAGLFEVFKNLPGFNTGSGTNLNYADTFSDQGNSGHIYNAENVIPYIDRLTDIGSVTLRDLMKMLFGLFEKGQIKTSDENIFTFRLLEVFLGISDTLSDEEKEKLINLLKDGNFHHRINKALHKRWTLSPESLREDITDKKFFRRLYEDLERLKNLSESSMFETTNIRTSINKLQDNLQFMRDLNDLFLYLQLPLRLAGQDAHGDLYVFTRKNKAYCNNEQLNVLLHLDMANLGPVDIHMTMKERQINAVFYLENLSEQLISAHLHELTETLIQLGYQIQAKTKVSESKPDFITDILQKDASVQNVSRYSFDIRA
ncbi:MAG TPA: flagellar hook-length control protein FliK [Mobilitalea sp.]|nr:flagellar hook-length control protein FliK [Mobilitalea sp.]